MKPLRVIAATLAAVLCAVGLSVGAALAEGHPDPAPTHVTPKGVCLLGDAAAR